MNFTILLIFQGYGSAWKLEILLCFLHLVLVLKFYMNIFDKLEVYCSKVFLINFIL